MDVRLGAICGGLTLEPWSIEILKREKKRKESSGIPLYLPLVKNPLTGSIGQAKKKERRGSAKIDYSL